MNLMFDARWAKAQHQRARTQQQRIKFHCVRLPSDPQIQDGEWKPLAAALATSKALGAAPLLPDGRGVGGNGAVLSHDGKSIVVSRSGRSAGTRYDATHFVRVHSFDGAAWTAAYSSADPEARPSSDVPLLWHALMAALARYGWTTHPNCILHGHSWKTAADAKLLGAPCSTRANLFSTPEDLAELAKLLGEFAYPEHKLFVRLGHGFFLLAESPEEAVALFRRKLEEVEKAKAQRGQCTGKGPRNERRHS